MDDTLKRLLDAELRAEEIVEAAKAEREQITQRALDDARNAERRFAERVPEIHRVYLEKAEARAAQTIAELKRRYDERNRELRRIGEQHEQDAIDAAFDFVVNPEKA